MLMNNVRYIIGWVLQQVQDAAALFFVSSMIIWVLKSLISYDSYRVDANIAYSIRA